MPKVRDTMSQITTIVLFMILIFSSLALAVYIYAQYNKHIASKEAFRNSKGKGRIEEEFKTYSEVCLGGFCMPKFAVQTEIDAMDSKTKNMLMDMLKNPKDS